MEDKRYQLSLEADNDLDEIFDYTEEKFGFNQAVKYLTELEDTFYKLSKNQLIGRPRNEIKNGLYSIIKSSHIVFYRPMKSYIRIIRILHGSRDLRRFFD